MLLHLKLVGALLLALASLHVGFPAYFRWRTELAALRLINRQLMQVHTFFVALTVALMGALCLSSAPDLAGTPLGRRLCLGLAVFWGARLVAQFGWYSPALWRGKRFETAVHVLFSALWLYISSVFGWVAWGN